VAALRDQAEHLDLQQIARLRPAHGHRPGDDARAVGFECGRGERPRVS
jgi:hypothetical protein